MSPNWVRLVVLSDTHNRHKAMTRLLPPVNPTIPTILIHCGDFADRGNLLHVRSFCRWLARDEHNPDGLPALPSGYHHVVVVKGNHDISRNQNPVLDLDVEFAKCNAKLQKRGIDRRVHFLRDQTIDLAGLRIHGSDWERALDNDYKAVVNAPDVLVSHCNPCILAQAQQNAQSLNGRPIPFRAWQGSKGLFNIAMQQNIPFVLSGHVHWGRGAVYMPNHDYWIPQSAPRVNGTWFINASNTNPGCGSPSDEKDPSTEVTAPVVIDYDLSKRHGFEISCPEHTAYS